jgi:hypothetical protein
MLLRTPLPISQRGMRKQRLCIFSACPVNSHLPTEFPQSRSQPLMNIPRRRVFGNFLRPRVGGKVPGISPCGVFVGEAASVATVRVSSNPAALYNVRYSSSARGEHPVPSPGWLWRPLRGLGFRWLSFPALPCRALDSSVPSGTGLRKRLVVGLIVASAPKESSASRTND